jgi:ATP-dependent RNA helicase DeaD
MNKFESYGLNPKLLEAIKEMGFENPSPVQEKTIPYLLQHERDVIALAQTGTGKTAAFGLPILHKTNPKDKTVQYLILCPTRELCLQIATEMEKFCKYLPEVSISPIYGGANMDAQIKKLKKGSQIVVATPGRIHDMIRRRKVDLSRVKTVVLDEADEMLNMGFQEDLNAILSETPKEKNTHLFSATMSKAVADIAMDYMVDPIEFILGKKNTGSKNIHHTYYLAHSKDKYAVLKRILDLNSEIYGLIFCRTRQDAKNTADMLMKDGYDVDALHGDLSHAQREGVMSKFRHRNLQILVATDVAARGLDVTNLTHVIHFTLPEELEIYTHRSGRTGRKESQGTSVAIIQPREISKIHRIEKIIEQKFTEEEVPKPGQILENRIAALARKLEKTDPNEKTLGSYMKTFYENLPDREKDDIIKRFLTIELGRFIDFYKNIPDIKAPDRHETSGGGGRERSGKSFGRKGKPFNRGGERRSEKSGPGKKPSKRS